ncbi:O-fucosyltransferase 3-like isoform X1 [Cucurbita maxima]|uniref:O-fucosyltransferase family protein n=1 Tax=Cucurbita maxima TaxID=3661 RepID=A0A6J1JLY3_CUCMA|nr:O-fucosyltransferase 3-like isoform X1 [Cucurbita maxima]
MEVRSEGVQVRSDKLPVPVVPRTRLQVWFVRVCSSILLWTFFVQLVAFGKLWHPLFISNITNRISQVTGIPLSLHVGESIQSAPLLPARNYSSNGYLRVSCNGGLNQMRAAICDMVTVARLLNLTLVVPELDKTSFWADPRYVPFLAICDLVTFSNKFQYVNTELSCSNFDDIFNVKHFIDSLRDEVRIVRRLPKKFNRKHGFIPFSMPPVSWSNEKYYLEQILPLFKKHTVLHFNKTDARLANNGIPVYLQKLRCRVNFQALKFSPQIETLGYKLIRLLQEKGPIVVLHLRYEMDMLAFSGCTHGCTTKEADELKQMRYAFPWWREKEILSEERRSQGQCPLTPEEAALTLQALGFNKETQLYIAAGEIYGSERRLATLREAFPMTVKKEALLSPEELKLFRNHSSQMAALDFMVSVASNTFIPTYDGNMARLVEGHRRYLGFKRTITLDRKKLVELVDMHQNGTLSWDDFAAAVRLAHEKRQGQPLQRRAIPDKPKEEDYFYANPHECFCEGMNCHHSNSSEVL